MAGSEIDANARGHRASICVRACVGLEDAFLENPEYSIKEELDSLDKQIQGRLKAERQRDAMKKALEVACAQMERCKNKLCADGDFNFALDMVRNALKIGQK